MDSSPVLRLRFSSASFRAERQHRRLISFRRFTRISGPTEERSKLPSALQDISILEFGSNLAAAYSSMLLAEQGACVIRLERPEISEDERRSPHYRVLNRKQTDIRGRFLRALQPKSGE